MLVHIVFRAFRHWPWFAAPPFPGFSRFDHIYGVFFDDGAKISQLEMSIRRIVIQRLPAMAPERCIDHRQNKRLLLVETIRIPGDFIDVEPDHSQSKNTLIVSTEPGN